MVHRDEVAGECRLKILPVNWGKFMFFGRGELTWACAGTDKPRNQDCWHDNRLGFVGTGGGGQLSPKPEPCSPPNKKIFAYSSSMQ